MTRRIASRGARPLPALTAAALAVAIPAAPAVAVPVAAAEYDLGVVTLPQPQLGG